MTQSPTTEAAVAASSAFTLGELMVAAAAREIKDGEVVFVGMRLPLIAFVVAKHTHAPNAVGLFENGVIRTTPARELIYTMADPPNILGATQCLDMLSVMSLLQSGRVHMGFLGAAEVDRFGNLNSTQVRADSGRRPTTDGSFVRLPGSGGACDIASLAQRFVVLMEHSKRRLPERVSYITSPGNGEGGNWRARVGLPRGGPSACITTKAVLRFSSTTTSENTSAGIAGEACLATVHPGVTVDDVLANTGWKLRVASDVTETPVPTAAELAAIRNYDREGFLDAMTAHQTATFARLTLNIAPPVARITLTNPPQNVIDLPMMDELVAALEQIEQRSDISVTLLAGDEKAFSAGVDVAAHTPDQVAAMLGKFHSVIRALVSSRKVTVAAVRGNCFGGGAELALVCDVVYTTASAKWGFPEIKLACFPPVAAVALAVAVGQKRAADLVLSGRTITGAEAAQMGLANEAVSDVELESVVESAIARLGELSPAALAVTKKALYSWDAIHFDKGLARAEQIYLNELMKTEDAHEGINAFMEKRAPKWTGK